MLIDEKKLFELRDYNKNMHSETEWLRFFHANFTEMASTIEQLLKVARAAKAIIYGPRTEYAQGSKKALLKAAIEGLKGPL